MKSIMISISKVSSFDDTRPILCRLPWGEFVESCYTPVVRGALPLEKYLTAEKSIRDMQKNGPAMIAGIFSRPGTRNQGDMIGLSLVTLDFDDGHYSFERLCEALQRFEAVVFTSYSHSSDKPKLRAYLPLKVEIIGHVKQVLERIIDYFDDHVGHIDPAGRKPGQLFYLPACPPGGECLYQARHLSGYVLDPADFPEMPAQAPLQPRDQNQAAPERQAISAKPGDVFNAKANWADLLEPLGWRRCYGNHWTRPGKKFGVSATVLTSGFYVHSSDPATAPFICGKTYTLFGAFAAIHHGGDYSAAARDLRRLAL